MKGINNQFSKYIIYTELGTVLYQSKKKNQGQKEKRIEKNPLEDGQSATTTLLSLSLHIKNT